ncbi:hypothetical protein AURDEDRAFT_163232 [Auricularia subglabra TFB-10046 SS5]|nr:hypothetical protein AURDEDRAFT_163232 [Auricularia subglabra TFB-10046 SS5]
MVLIATLCFAALASALTLNTPTNWQSSSNSTVTWTSAPGDPATFSIELVQPTLLNGPLAVVDSATTSNGSISFNLPAVPEGSGYTLEAVAISNINDVLSTSGSFSIAPAPVVSASTPTGTASVTLPIQTTPATSPTVTAPVSSAPGPSSSGGSSSAPAPLNPGNAAGRVAVLPFLGTLTTGVWAAVGAALIAL